MKNPKLIAAGIAAFLGLIVVIVSWNGLVGHNDFQNYQIYQSAGGTVTVIDGQGYYPKFFGTTWTYPRVMEFINHNDDSIKATFNDGGTAQVSTYTKLSLPTTEEHRLLLHQQFNGNPDNIKTSVRAHLENCVKAAAPIMSASENQASRKGEFNQIIEAQLSVGLYKTRRTKIELDDLSTIEDGGLNDKGEKITREKKATVQATEIVIDPKTNNPSVIQASPLLAYGLNVLQFSIKDIEYDKTTLDQFAAKKTSYLAAEQAKAERQQEVQQRLMIEEKGRRQVAEVQAKFNQAKEQALIQANQDAEVAVITKEQAVTKAKQATEVAQQAQVEAEALRKIAEINAATAELAKKSKISQAEAQQKAIELGGGITEKERVLAEIKAGRDEKVAQALATLKVPNVVIGGGSGTTGGSDGITSNLINLKLLETLGILDAATVAK